MRMFTMATEYSKHKETDQTIDGDNENEFEF